MSTLTVYRKSDGKAINCDRSQFDALTKGEKAEYSAKPVAVKAEKESKKK